MIALVDEDRDGKVSFREFLMIFRKQNEGELESDSGLDKLVKLTEIDVSATVIFEFFFEVTRKFFLGCERSEEFLPSQSGRL